MCRVSEKGYASISASCMRATFTNNNNKAQMPHPGPAQEAILKEENCQKNKVRDWWKASSNRPRRLHYKYYCKALFSWVKWQMPQLLPWSLWGDLGQQLDIDKCPWGRGLIGAGNTGDMYIETFLQYGVNLCFKQSEVINWATILFISQSHLLENAYVSIFCHWTVNASLSNLPHQLLADWMNWKRRASRNQKLYSSFVFSCSAFQK